MHEREKKFSRRTFVSTMAAAAAIPLISGKASEFLFSPAAAKRTIHVFSKPLVWLGYEELSEILAASGAEGIDLMVRPAGHVLPENVERDLPKAVEAAKRAGLKIEMIVTGIVSPDDKYTEPVLKAASQLGIQYYRFGNFDYNENLGVLGTLEKLRADMQKFAKLNQKYNMHGAIQNHVGTRVGAQIWDLWELLKDIDPTYVGCQYDVRHAVVEGANSWVNNLKLISPWVKCTDFKDFEWVKTNGKWNPVSVPAGEGMVNFDTYFNIVKKFDIKGPVSIHYEYPPFERFTQQVSKEEKKKLYITAMKKDIDFLRSCLTKYQL
jgi:L-ribulose-5-phosphate 3-epimerase